MIYTVLVKGCTFNFLNDSTNSCIMAITNN